MFGRSRERAVPAPGRDIADAEALFKEGKTKTLGQTDTRARAVKEACLPNTYLPMQHTPTHTHT